MLPDEAGGDARKGFVALVGEPIFDCGSVRESLAHAKSQQLLSSEYVPLNLVLIHRRFLFRQDLRLQTLINAVAVRVEFRR